MKVLLGTGERDENGASGFTPSRMCAERRPLGDARPGTAHSTIPQYRDRPNCFRWIENQISRMSWPTEVGSTDERLLGSLGLGMAAAVAAHPDRTGTDYT